MTSSILSWASGYRVKIVMFRQVSTSCSEGVFDESFSLVLGDFQLMAQAELNDLGGCM